MRKVNVFFQQAGDLQSVESDAYTFGEFKEKYPEFNFSNKKVVVKESLVTLEVDDAKLPDEEFTLFVYPQKSKAGADENPLSKYTITQVTNMLGNNLRRAIRRLNAKGVTSIDETLSTEEQRKELITAIRSSNRSSDKREKATPIEKKKSRKEKSTDSTATFDTVAALDRIDNRLEAIQKSVDGFAENIADAISEAFESQAIDEELESIKKEAAYVRAELGIDNGDE